MVSCEKNVGPAGFEPELFALEAKVLARLYDSPNVILWSLPELYKSSSASSQFGTTRFPVKTVHQPSGVTSSYAMRTSGARLERLSSSFASCVTSFSCP